MKKKGTVSWDTLALISCVDCCCHPTTTLIIVKGFAENMPASTEYGLFKIESENNSVLKSNPSLFMHVNKMGMK